MLIDLGDLLVRSFRPEDEAALSRHGDHPDVAAGLRDRFPQPYTVDDARRWIGFARSQAPERHFAIATREEAVGCIGLEIQSDVGFRCAELGYWIGREWWGQGLTTRAVKAFVRQAYGRYGIVRIFAQVFETNPGSARVLEKCGFELEGRLRKSVHRDGRDLDQLLWARVLDDEEARRLVDRRGRARIGSADGGLSER